MHLKKTILDTSLWEQIGKPMKEANSIPLTYN